LSEKKQKPLSTYLTDKCQIEMPLTAFMEDLSLHFCFERLSQKRIVVQKIN